jgi:hypothetical protein
MFCGPGIIFGGAECVGSRFHILRFRTHFRRYRGRRVPFSCFALPESFSAVPRASGPVLMFCAPRIIFGGTGAVGSRFQVLLSRNQFQRYRGRRDPFSCFAVQDSCLAVPRASGPVFLFCALELFFGCTDGVRSPFSCFARPDSFSAVPRASGPVFMFCAPGIIFNGAECVGSHFHILRSPNRFRRCRVCQVPFLCFALPESFSAVPRASGPVFLFCAPVLVFGGTEGVGSRFHVLRARTHFRRYRVRRVAFSCFALPESFSTVSGASGSHFHVLRSRTRFRRYLGCRVQFSCFALTESFLAVPR